MTIQTIDKTITDIIYDHRILTGYRQDHRLTIDKNIDGTVDEVADAAIDETIDKTMAIYGTILRLNGAIYENIEDTFL